MQFRAISLALMLLSFLSNAYASDSHDAATLTLAERVVIASQMYSVIQLYFGHWKGVPNLDLDREYERYVEHVIATDDRRIFDLASLEFLATLQNGHSGFFDQWLRDKFGQRIGFYAYPIDGEWVVTHSSIPDLKPGEIIISIDEQSLESFYQQNRKYISASDERWRRRAFFESTYLFPTTFAATLKGGRKVNVTRQSEFQSAGTESHSIETSARDGIAVLRIPAFTPQSLEDSAVDFLKKLGPVKALLIDLRGNHGGSTPSTLVDALMDRPYRWMAESTLASFAVFRAWNMLGSHTDLTFPFQTDLHLKESVLPPMSRFTLLQQI